MIDTLLEKAGLKYEDLNASEKETLNVWSETIQKGQISVEKIRDYISSMKQSVEQEICKNGTDTKQDLFLKARLRNYMLLEAFISTPEKAKQQLENAISSLVRK